MLLCGACTTFVCITSLSTLCKKQEFSQKSYYCNGLSAADAKCRVVNISKIKKTNDNERVNVINILGKTSISICCHFAPIKQVQNTCILTYLEIKVAKIHMYCKKKVSVNIYEIVLSQMYQMSIPIIFTKSLSECMY